MYAKLISESIVDTVAPVYATIDGELIWDIPSMPDAQTVYASIGWYPFVNTPEPTPRPGFHNVSSYTLEDGQIVRVWTEEQDEVPEPIVHTYRKSWLAQWLHANDLLDNLDGILLQNASAKMLWDYCTEFDDNDPRFSQIIQGVVQGLGLTNEQAEEMLHFGEFGTV